MASDSSAPGISRAELRAVLDALSDYIALNRIQVPPTTQPASQPGREEGHRKGSLTWCCCCLQVDPVSSSSNSKEEEAMLAATNNGEPVQAMA